MKIAVAVVSVLVLAGCQSRNMRSAEQADAACRAQTFRTAVELVRCRNNAARLIAEEEGSSRDLLDVALAKRMVLAERVDRKEITRAEAELEMSQTMAHLNSEKQSRGAIAVQNYQSHMQRTNQLANTFQRPRPITCTSQPQFGQVQTTCQ